MHRIINTIVFFSLVSLSIALADTPFDTAKVLCSATQACLGNTPISCTAEQLKPNPEIKYDLPFCEHYKTLLSEGVTYQSPNAKAPWAKLGLPLRIQYETSGLLPIRFQAMQYLLGHLSLATELINAYRGTKYSVSFTNADSTAFNANNGRNLSGSFSFLTLRKSETGRYVFYGEGYAEMEVLMRLLGQPNAKGFAGDALTFLDVNPVGAKTAWQLRLVVFPDNATVNMLLGTGVFRNAVIKYITEIIGDISNSASQYAKGNRDPIAKSAALTHGPLQQQLLVLEQLLKEPETPETKTNP